MSKVIPILTVLTVSLFLFTNTISAQITTNSQWTWIKGDSTRNQHGIYGTQGVPAAANKPGGRENAVSWTDGLGNFWLFGGWGYSAAGYGMLNDLWKYDPTTNQWTWINGDKVEGH